MLTDRPNLLANLDRFLGAQPEVRVGTDLIYGVRPRTYGSVIEGPTGVWTVNIERAHRAHWNGRLALAASRRAGMGGPQFTRPAPVQYTISDVIAGHDYTVEQWLARTSFVEEVLELDRREALTNQRNQRIADEWAAKPVNVAAVAQQAREAAVKAELPTEQADAFLVQELGYDANEVAGWAPSTRRPRRRAARGMVMAMRRDDIQAMRKAGEQVSGADWRARVDALIARMTRIAEQE